MPNECSVWSSALGLSLSKGCWLIKSTDRIPKPKRREPTDSVKQSGHLIRKFPETGSSNYDGQYLGTAPSGPPGWDSNAPRHCERRANLTAPLLISRIHETLNWPCISLMILIVELGLTWLIRLDHLNRWRFTISDSAGCSVELSEHAHMLSGSSSFQHCPLNGDRCSFTAIECCPMAEVPTRNTGQ